MVFLPDFTCIPTAEQLVACQLCTFRRRWRHSLISPVSQTNAASLLDAAPGNYLPTRGKPRDSGCKLRCCPLAARKVAANHTNLDVGGLEVVVGLLMRLSAHLRNPPTIEEFYVALSMRTEMAHQTYHSLVPCPSFSCCREMCRPTNCEAGALKLRSPMWTVPVPVARPNGTGHSYNVGFGKVVVVVVVLVTFASSFPWFTAWTIRHICPRPHSVV